MLLFYPHPADPHLLLTVRHPGLPTHAGQVSLPGGLVEEGESFEEAALREAREEVGVDPASVTLLGRLTPLHIPVSRFILHPVVGVADPRPGFRPSDGEVDRILEVPLADLCDPGLRRTEVRDEGRGRVADVPYLALHGEKVWGATAMVLSELVEIVKREAPQGRP